MRDPGGHAAPVEHAHHTLSPRTFLPDSGPSPDRPWPALASSSLGAEPAALAVGDFVCGAGEPPGRVATGGDRRCTPRPPII